MSSEASHEYFFLVHSLERTKAFKLTCLHLICDKTLGKLQSPSVLGRSNPARYHTLNDFYHFHTNRTSKNSKDLRFHHHHYPSPPSLASVFNSCGKKKSTCAPQSNLSSALGLPFQGLQHRKLTTSLTFTSNYRIQNHRH